MLKRLLDLLLSLLGLIVLSPIFLLITLIIYAFNGPPVLYIHQRLGKNSKVFNFYKFRTMKLGESLGSKHDAKRITSIGKFLRKTSLDELPALFNVIKNDMSLVGPRPLPLKYKNRFYGFQNRRHEVQPGMTGLAQVKGRNTISWEEKFEYDVYYADHCNLLLDLKILFITLFQVLKGQGVNPDGQDIMPEFMGTKNANKPYKTD